MRMTLLEMVQDILSALESDEVNSISDTVESMQVATAVKHAYNDIVSRANLPEHFNLFELNPSLDPLKPTLMHLPQDVMNLLWVKYDIRAAGDTEPNYQLIQYLTPDEFWQRVLTLNDQNQGDTVSYQIETVNNSTIDIIGLKNKGPNWYTSFNDRDIIFDSYDETVDGTLQKDKTVCYGELVTSFRMEDDFIPDLDPRQFSLLYNESKASCFADIKQTTNERAEAKVKKGWVTLQHQKSAIPAQPNFRDTLANYGRRGFNGRSTNKWPSGSSS